MNEFFVGMQGETVVIMRRIPQHLTRQQAISLAAWLTVIADPSGKQVSIKVQEIQQ